MYRLPEFPIICAVFRAATPIGGPPDLESPCNLAFGRRATPGCPGTPELDDVPAVLLLPPGTDIRDGNMPGGADVVEVPSGSGRVYRAAYVNDLGTGFPNEHRFAVLQKLAPWPAPLPPVYVPPAGRSDRSAAGEGLSGSRPAGSWGPDPV